MVVFIQLFLVRAGGQGIPSPRVGDDRVPTTHYEYWISPEAAAIANRHENDHRHAVEREFDRLIAPLLQRIDDYREPRVLQMSPAGTEDECRMRLEKYIDWRDTLSQYHRACADQDLALDQAVAASFGTIHALRGITNTASTDNLVVPYPVPPHWLARP